jgi:hypothetical protein
MPCRVNLSWKVHHLRASQNLRSLSIFAGFLNVGSLLARHKKQVMPVPRTTITIESAVIAFFLFVASTIDRPIDRPSIDHQSTIDRRVDRPSIYHQSTNRSTINRPINRPSIDPSIDHRRSTPSIDHRSTHRSTIDRPSINPSIDY